MALGKKTGGREAGTPNKKQSDNTRLKKLLKDFTPEAILEGFKKAKKKHGKISIVDHLCDKSYDNSILALALMRKIAEDLEKRNAIGGVEGEWAHKTPAEIAEEMGKLTIGDKNE